MNFPAPQKLKFRIKVPSKTLFGPGPSNCHPRVLHALGLPILGHMHPETFEIMDEVKEGLKYVFQTNNPLTLALSASGHGGMEAVLCNLIEKEDNVLVAVIGIWGERAAEMAKRCGANVTTISPGPDYIFSYDVLENAIVQHRPKLLFIVHGDSSVGTLQPLEGLGDICHRYNCLLVVDSVASLGGTELFVDRWGIDAIYSGSQKCLSAPPGITPISFSPRAQQVIFNRKTPVPVYYLDLTEIGDYWNCFGRPRRYHHTISATLLYGLREALAIIAEEGLENTIQRHKLCAKKLYQGLTDLNLPFYIKDSRNRLPTVTTVEIPDDTTKKIIAHCIQRYNVEVAGGIGATLNKIMRIGLMGYNVQEQNVDFLLKIIKEALTVSEAQSKL